MNELVEVGIVKSIKINHFELMKKRGWDKVYYAFDIHGTILKPNYTVGSTPDEFYPMAKEALQFISQRPDIVMFLYTCSHPKEIDEYLELFKKNGIHFKYVNENPEVPTQTNGYGCYDKKPYMNVLFDDKCGFSGEEDWGFVLNLLTDNYNGNNF